MSTAIAPETVQIIRQLEPREDVEAGLRRVLENEMRRRLAAYEWTDRMFQCNPQYQKSSVCPHCMNMPSPTCTS
jgi:hypothetical protein